MQELEEWRRDVDKTLAEFPYRWRQDIAEAVFPIKEGVNDIKRDIREIHADNLEIKEGQKVINDLHEASIKQAGAVEKRQSNFKNAGAILVIISGTAAVLSTAWNFIAKIYHMVIGH